MPLDQFQDDVLPGETVTRHLLKGRTQTVDNDEFVCAAAYARALRRGILDWAASSPCLVMLIAAARRHSK
ncbi:hypothetical protein LuPra_00948 [Luteitalea pratensis]|uniref:Uncharacterized protein n=1 Tax=Luteitalea pratensis TaxID=1855912 RepID=A0A143PGS9_LUTPR|nr:hypothetical protein [Luteitalea pratensis]AMY07767.1 hypothetical protein LuPra_00948 [Luteitalea pratensis]